MHTPSAQESGSATPEGIAFILHGRLSNIDRLQSQIRSLFERGFQVSFFITASPGQAESLARSAVEAGFRILIAVGGDGTVSDAINGLLAAREGLPEDQQQRLRFGILPRGSGNDFVRNLQKSPGPELILDWVRQDVTSLVDVGLLTYRDMRANSTQRHFINIADVGLGGVVAQRISEMPFWVPAWFKYQFSIIRTLLGYRHLSIRITTTEGMREGSILALILANGKYFGKGLGIAPDAQLNDGKIAAVWIGKVTILEYLRYLPQIRRCRPIQHPELHYFQCEKMTISHLDKPLPIDLDGEFVGFTPVEMTVSPLSLRIYGRIN